MKNIFTNTTELCIVLKSQREAEERMMYSHNKFSLSMKEIEENLLGRKEVFMAWKQRIIDEQGYEPILEKIDKSIKEIEDVLK